MRFASDSASVERSYDRQIECDPASTSRAHGNRSRRAGLGGATIGGIARRVTEANDGPLVAVALQFPLAHPAVAAVIPGPHSAEEVESNLRALRHPIPIDLKREGLLREDAPTPADEVAYSRSDAQRTHLLERHADADAV
jgi:aryl-alcohol dehydrogenase-like predicted oxidoreductase